MNASLGGSSGDGLKREATPKRRLGSVVSSPRIIARASAETNDATLYVPAMIFLYRLFVSGSSNGR